MGLGPPIEAPNGGPRPTLPFIANGQQQTATQQGGQAPFGSGSAELAYLFIKRYNQLRYLKCAFLTPFLCLFVAIPLCLATSRTERLE